MKNGEKPSITYVPQQRATQEELNQPNGYENKIRSYLSFRSFGFSESEASRLSGLHHASIGSLRLRDPDFKAAEEALNSVPELENVIRREGNKVKLLHLHYETKLLLDTLAQGLEALPEEDRRYLFLSRAKPMQVSFQPQEQGTIGGVSLTINVGEQEIASVEARRAVAQQLLQDFDASKKYRNPDQPLIEGEVIE